MSSIFDVEFHHPIILDLTNYSRKFLSNRSVLHILRAPCFRASPGGNYTNYNHTFGYIWRRVTPIHHYKWSYSVVLMIGELQTDSSFYVFNRKTRNGGQLFHLHRLLFLILCIARSRVTRDSAALGEWVVI